jgi:hypothetical protein
LRVLILTHLIVVAKKLGSSYLLLLLAATFGVPCCADSFTFSLLPAGGNVSGTAGSTVGWGYSVSNLSQADWLVTTNLASDLFAQGTPSLLFDFPVLAPGATATEAFDAMDNVGLYEITWDGSAPSGYTNNGEFTLSAQWWSGDPTNGGTYIGDGPDATASYSATVSPSFVSSPEPATIRLSLSAILMAGMLIWRAKSLQIGNR